jgi:transmembrane sensor
MSAFRKLSPDQQQRLEAAAAWQLRLTREPSLCGSAEYRQWRCDPANAGARAAVGKGWSAMDALNTAPEVLELRRQALASMRRAQARRWNPRFLRIAAAAAVLIASMLGGTWCYVNRDCLADYLNTHEYKTDIGERRIVALTDGSRISMDSDTRVRVLFQRKARSISLERGRSRFDVAHDPNRPFTVYAGAQKVEAVGTSFDVERLQSTILVTLIQGQVLVESTAATATAENSISLKPGEEFVVSGNVRAAVVHADPQVARAWEAGRLLFRDEPLGDAVARVNRYTTHPIAIDPAIASIRFSGVFNAGDVSSFVSAVTSYFPILASTTANNSILLQPR